MDLRGLAEVAVVQAVFRPLEESQHVSNSASTSQGQDSISSLNRHRNAGPWTRLSRLETVLTLWPSLVVNEIMPVPVAVLRELEFPPLAMQPDRY